MMDMQNNFSKELIILSKAETEQNIDFWEKEVQKALLENDIMKACMCRVLANKLREDLEDE